MKSIFKRVYLLAFGCLLMLSLALTASATTINKDNAQTNSWFQDVSVNNIGDDKKAEINKEVKSKKTSNYYLIHNDGKELLHDQLTGLIAGDYTSVDDPLGTHNYLLGVGIENENGVIRTDFIFDQAANVTPGELKNRVLDMVLKRKFTTSPNIIAAAAPSYTDTYNWTIRNSNENNIIAGTYSSNVEYYKEGTTTIDNVKNTIWDMKYSNQIVPSFSNNGYQTRQVISRSSAENYADEKLLSYGPTTSSSGGSVSVSLTGYMPTFSWQFTLGDVKVTDGSDIAKRFARWTFDFPLGWNVAKNTFLMQPGARFANSSKTFDIQHHHSIWLYKNLSYSTTFYTGALTRSITDL